MATILSRLAGPSAVISGLSRITSLICPGLPSTGSSGELQHGEKLVARHGDLFRWWRHEHAPFLCVHGNQGVGTYERSRSEHNVVRDAGVNPEKAIVADRHVARERHMGRHPHVVPNGSTIAEVVPGPDRHIVSNGYVKVEDLTVENETVLANGYRLQPRAAWVNIADEPIALLFR